MLASTGSKRVNYQVYIKILYLSCHAFLSISKLSERWAGPAVYSNHFNHFLYLVSCVSLNQLVFSAAAASPAEVFKPAKCSRGEEGVCEALTLEKLRSDVHYFNFCRCWNTWAAVGLRWCWCRCHFTDCTGGNSISTDEARSHSHAGRNSFLFFFKNHTM